MDSTKNCSAVVQKRRSQLVVSAVCFVFCCAACWSVLSHAARAADDSETEAQSEEEVTDSDGDRGVRATKGGARYFNFNRPLTAQTTAGYSRLRPVKKRVPEPMRPVRSPSEDSQLESGFDRRESGFDQRSDSDPRSGFEQPSGNDRRSGNDQRSGFEQRPDSGRDSTDVEPADREQALSAPRSTRRPSRAFPTSSTSTSSSEATSEPASLVADDGGPVAEILLHYSVTSESELGTIYRDLFEQLSPTVQLQVCCPTEQSAEAFTNRWGPAAVGPGRSVHVVNVNRPITVWARDRRICRQTSDGQLAACFVPTAHATYDPEKQNDLVLTSLLWSTGLVPGVALTSMHLEGGNVVSNRRHVFVGANAFEDNEHRFDSEGSLYSELGRLFGRPAIAIQALDGEVPWIHTDMYLTPVDSKTVLVASPVLGCDLLPHRKTIPAVNRGKQTTIEFDLVNSESIRQQRFDDVAKQLTNLGYQVIRMPALVNVQKDWMVTYNNVIMDYQDGQRVVYMPIYNIPELDQAATQTYRALGFEVKPIDVSAIFQLGGAIRCLANVTRRLPFETRFQSHEPEGAGRLQVYSVDPSANRVREVRPRREKRPFLNPSRDRQDQPTQGYSAAGTPASARPEREQPEREQFGRQQFEQRAPVRERPDFIGRQPVDTGS